MRLNDRMASLAQLESWEAEEAAQMEALLKSERDNLRIGYGDEDDDDEEEGEEEDPENPTDPVLDRETLKYRAQEYVRKRTKVAGKKGGRGRARAAGVGVDLQEMVRGGRTGSSA